MAIWNLGSINADHAYSVPHIPGPGETLSASALTSGLGGKGANMSVAAARAAAHVAHIGAVGQDGRWALERLTEYGVDTRFVAVTDAPTGHANICVAADGENSIVIFAGANHAITDDMLGLALSEAARGDVLLMQNETNAQEQAAKVARDLGLGVVYAAAPFDAEKVRALLPMLDMLVLNEVEAEQLAAATGLKPADLGLKDVVVTLGSRGCRWISAAGIEEWPAPKVDPVDTTGAGDTFTGYLLAGLDRGQPMPQAIATAQKAAALMVTRLGTADVIPDMAEVRAFAP